MPDPLPGVRPSIAADRDAINRIAARVGVFSADEVRTVADLLDIYLSDAGQDEFLFLSAVIDGRVAGFACYGPIALTARNYELYWLGTDPDAGRRGAASALLNAVERIALSRGARFVNLQTSATPPYAPARKFYVRQGYSVAARLPDYYSDGDEMVLYRKELRG